MAGADFTDDRPASSGTHTAARGRCLLTRYRRRVDARTCFTIPAA